MIPEQKLAGLLNTTIQNQDGMAAWFFPGEQNPEIIAVDKNDIVTYTHPDEIAGQTGFVFAPFQSTDFEKPVFLKSSSVLQSPENISINKPADLSLPAADRNTFSEIDRKQYLKKCHALIREIKSGKADKVVFSRVIWHRTNHQQHPARVFLDIKAKYPDAFCYLFFTPQTGLWMGATPETLLYEKSGKLKTMALAGTRPVSSPESKPLPWPEKEKVEQKFVSDYIFKTLSDLGIPAIKMSEPYTIAAGKIEHIQTDFVIEKSGTDVTTGKIINALHPTPAVCGIPKKAAFEIIGNTEAHRRSYYTGYLGPVNKDSEKRLFVNLRCMKVDDDGFTIFAGGGITAASDAGLEWKETEMKASILKSVIETD